MDNLFFKERVSFGAEVHLPFDALLQGLAIFVTFDVRASAALLQDVEDAPAALSRRSNPLTTNLNDVRDPAMQGFCWSLIDSDCSG